MDLNGPDGKIPRVVARERASMISRTDVVAPVSNEDLARAAGGAAALQAAGLPLPWIGEEDVPADPKIGKVLSGPIRPLAETRAKLLGPSKVASFIDRVAPDKLDGDGAKVLELSALHAAILADTQHLDAEIREAVLKGLEDGSITEAQVREAGARSKRLGTPYEAELAALLQPEHVDPERMPQLADVLREHQGQGGRGKPAQAADGPQSVEALIARIARVRDYLPQETLDEIGRAVARHSKTHPDLSGDDEWIQDKDLRAILERVDLTEAERKANAAERQAHEHLVADKKRAWSEFLRLKPWTRKLFPFRMDLPTLGEIRVEVVADSQPGIKVTWRNGDEPERGAEQLVDPEAGYVVIFHVDDADPDFKILAQQEDGAHLKLGRRLFLDAEVALTCAILAVVDLLTREIRVVERKREVRKKIRPSKHLPTISYDYRPVIYAPKTVTVVRDRQIEVAQDRLRQEREREAAERAAKAAQEAQEAARVAAEAQADAEAEIARLNAQPRPRVKHLVPCHIRRVRMSVKHQLELARMMAGGWTPIDKEGNEIPFPRNGEYTIIRDQIRGSVEPEVVSRGALNAIVGSLEARD